MSHTLKKLTEKGVIKSLSYTHTNLDGTWVTVCKFTTQDDQYYDVSMNKNFDKSIEEASKRVLSLYDAKGSTTSSPPLLKKPEKKESKETNICKWSCEKCRCLSFYGLHKDTDLSCIVDLCEKFGNALSADHYCWNNDEKRYIAVVMEDYRDANDVVKEYGGTLVIHGRDITVMKGHFSEKKVSDPYIGCDKFVLPPRKVAKKKLSKEELDKELDEYMHKDQNSEEMDKKLDEYMREKSTSK